MNDEPAMPAVGAAQDDAIEDNPSVEAIATLRKVMMTKQVTTLQQYLPITYWFPKYIKLMIPGWAGSESAADYTLLIDDIIGGLTIGVMCIPQCMAYATLAGLSPVNGLYVALLAPILYCILGTSGQVHLGPVALSSIMNYDAISGYLTDIDEEENADEYAMRFLYLSSLIALQCGVIQMILGWIKIGKFFSNLLSHAVMIGFMSASALIIGMSQMKSLLNLKELQKDKFHIMLMSIISNLDKIDEVTLLLSVLFISILLVLKKCKNSEIGKRHKLVKFIPSALILVVVSTILTFFLKEKCGFDSIEIVGDLQSGLPSVDVSFLQTRSIGTDFVQLLPASFIIGVIAFIETYSIGNKYGNKLSYFIDSTQELKAIGYINVIIAFFGGFTVSGSFSRSTLSFCAGSKTPFFSFITSLLIFVSLLWILPCFYYLPKSALGSIVAIAIINLFDVKEMVHLYKFNASWKDKRDFMVCGITFICTLWLGIEYGIGVGVIASILMFLLSQSYPSYSVQESHRDILVFRWNSSLFFANIQSFKYLLNKEMHRFTQDAAENHVHPICLVLDFGAINLLDSTTVQEMKKVVVHLKSVFDHITITNLRSDIYVLFEDADIMIEHRFNDVSAAVTWWRMIRETQARSLDEHTVTARMVTDEEDGEDHEDAVIAVLDSSKGTHSDDHHLIRFNTPLLCLEDLPLNPL